MQLHYKYFLLFLYAFSSFSAIAQVEGIVTDSKGNPIPLVNVRVISDSTKGTTTNNIGYYQMKLESGNYQLLALS